MSILDYFKRGATTDGGPTTEQPASATTPTTVAELLAQLETQRPALEQRFEAEAHIFATELRSARKIFPEASERAAFQWLTAKCDDAQFGGKVLFCQRDAQGQLIEVEGTRVQQIEALYADALPHSLADERVASVREGRTKAFALPPSPAAQAPKQEAGDHGTEMSDDEVLNATPAGQRVKARTAAGQSSTAVN